uniref:Tubulin-specific chaperone D n=1 Tax=Clastoptera arizonana TaxID=38151 RepID=A0A1B6E9Z8_9HEMI
MANEESECDNFDDEDCPGTKTGLACALEMFSESNEVINLIGSLPSFLPTHESEISRDFEKSHERFRYIINQYKEQPHLIDPYLDEILSNIVTLVRNPDLSLEIKHKAFKYLQLLTVVRGYKVVAQHLPHEVSDLEPTLKLLEEQDEKDPETWETRYSLLIWLSIIVMIPFHMSRLDGDSSKATIMSRLVEICKKYLKVTDTCRHAAAFLSAKLLTRVDVKEIHLSPFINWACEVISQQNSISWEKFGPLMSIAAILKHGKREDLLPYATQLLTCIMNSKCPEDQHILSRKYAIKIISRIGLTFLKVRVASWRYKRGCRLLALNLGASSDELKNGRHLETNNIKQDEDDDEGEDFDEVPEEIEDVIEEIIQALKNPGSTIRWSAAKGIGRIMGRLSKDLGDEIVGSILELLNSRESEGAWHGGCLALAELGKRGLLLPSRLPEVIPVITKALTYDIPRGYNSVGSSVRDSACYVCWAFARAYDPLVLEPYVKDIANALLITTCFDREINCRRAASAAFQENVGRLGNVPHGIDVVTTADYFAVGVRKNAFLNISTYIAQYEEYTTSLIDHVLQRKVDHWDPVIRELTAKALHNLCIRAPKYMAQNVIPALLKETLSIDSNARHGAILAVGEVVHGLSLLDNEKIDDNIIGEIGRLTSTLKERQQFRGVSGELMKLACCHLAQKCSQAKLPYHGQKVLEDWLELIDDCLNHRVNNVRSHAASALPYICNEYYIRNGEVVEDMRNYIIGKYTAELTVTNETTRMGYALALGSLPAFMFEKDLNVVISNLITCATITENTSKWAEGRREALKALTSICTAVGFKRQDKHSCYNLVGAVIECFLDGLNDYTNDSRGDIGAWVREASMLGLQIVLIEVEPDYLTESIISRVFVGVCQQAVEKIDRTRGYAGRVFSSLLHSSPPLPHVPHRTELERIFPKKECMNSINWISASDTFPLFIQLLRLPVYSHGIMVGLVGSVGGLTESLVKYSSSSLYAFLEKLSNDELTSLCNLIADIFVEYQHIDRITLPLMTFLERLLSSNCLHRVLGDSECTFPIRILKSGKEEISKTSDHKKLTACVDLFCQLIQVSGEVSKRSLTQLGILLCHRFLWLRKIVASKLYEALTVYSDECEISPENLENALTLLGDTEWHSLSLQDVRSTRNQLCQLLHISVPVVKK